MPAQKAQVGCFKRQQQYKKDVQVWGGQVIKRDILQQENLQQNQHYKAYQVC
jgi:hypothetical protein